MANNPHAPGQQKSTSFQYAQVSAMAQLFDVLRRGGDPKILLRAKAVREAEAKFRRMLVRLDDERARLARGESVDTGDAGEQ